MAIERQIINGIQKECLMHIKNWVTLREFYIKFLVFVLIILLLFSCNGNNKGDYKRTSKVCDKLYLEVYRTFGSGASGGDINANYVTDSTTFRFFVGEYDNYDSHFSCKSTGDTLYIYKLHKAESDTAFQIIKTSTYSISNLMQQHNIGSSSIETIK